MLNHLIDFENLSQQEAQAIAKTFINFAALGIFSHILVLLGVLTGLCFCTINKVKGSLKIKKAVKDSMAVQQEPLNIPKRVALNY